MTLSDELRAFRDRARHAPPHVHRCPECYEPEACGLDCDIEPDLRLDSGAPCGSYLVCSGCRKADERAAFALAREALTAAGAR